MGSLILIVVIVGFLCLAGAIWYSHKTHTDAFKALKTELVVIKAKLGLTRTPQPEQPQVPFREPPL